MVTVEQLLSSNDINSLLANMTISEKQNLLSRLKDTYSSLESQKQQLMNTYSQLQSQFSQVQQQVDARITNAIIALVTKIIQTKQAIDQLQAQINNVKSKIEQLEQLLSGG